MKVRNACLGVGLALSLGISVPAGAADWGSSGGSTKDYSRGATPVPAVAVPAPVPVPEYRGGWYFRFDAGAGVIDQPSTSESGFIYGRDDGPGPTTGPADERYLNTSWFSNDFETFATLGGGVGYDFGRGWRADATVEKRTMNIVQIDGSDTWDHHEYSTGCGGCTTYAVLDADGNGIADQKTTIKVNDKTKLDGTIWLANIYYDLFTSRGFTPYIGAGAGIAWNVISRRHQNDVTTCDNTSTPACSTQVAYSSTDVYHNVDKATFAGAVMAGVSYDLSDMTTLDFGYRYMHIAGTEVSVDIPDTKGNVDHSRLKIGDQNVHQLRAGVRLNFN
jgi:opacity protein-like surface antigen